MAHVGIDGHHVLFGSPEVLGECRPGNRKIDREMLATRYPRAKLTEPGDVIVTTIPRLGAIVDRAGFCVVEFPARILRIPRTEQDQFTSRVLAALLTAEGAGARAASAVRPVLRLEERRLALPSPVEVALLDTLLAELDERSGVAQREIDMLDELRDVATAGLIDGTLTLAGDNT